MKKYSPKKALLSYFIVLATIVADQLTKVLITGSFGLSETHPLIPGILHLTYVRNTGAAFGMLKNHRWLFLVVSAVAIVFMLVLLFIWSRHSTALLTTVALIAGGGVGNMIDRLRLGYVIDFIDVRAINFAVFNVADACVSVGCALLLIYILFFDKKTAVPLFHDKKASGETDGGGQATS